MIRIRPENQRMRTRMSLKTMVRMGMIMLTRMKARAMRGVIRR